MFVLNILCDDLLGTNHPEGWVRTGRKWLRNVEAWVRIVRVRKIHGYETTGYPYNTVLHYLTVKDKNHSKIVHYICSESSESSYHKV